METYFVYFLFVVCLIVTLVFTLGAASFRPWRLGLVASWVIFILLVAVILVPPFTQFILDRVFGLEVPWLNGALLLPHIAAVIYGVPAGIKVKEKMLG